MNDKDIEKALNTARSVAKGKSATFKQLGEMFGKTRSMTSGEAVPRYQQGDPVEAARRMYKDLIGLAREGEPGRMWYERSSKRILDYLGGDKDLADKFAQLIAIYSPQTSVPTNTQNAIKSFNRAQAGHKLWDGKIIDRDRTFDTAKEANDYIKSLGGKKNNITRVPLDDSGKRFLIAQHGKDYENIATKDRDLKAHLVMNENIPFEGRKINNFYNNLMVHIDPHRLQGSTQDLWMARAFGFLSDAVGSTGKYDYMEKLTHKIAKELGWEPHQVQAAIWTAMKTRMEGVKNDVKKEVIEKGLGTIAPDPKDPTKNTFQMHDGKDAEYASLMRERALGAPLTPHHIADSARDFSDFLDHNLAHVAWESAPSTRVKHLEGFDELTPEQKAEYHVGISQALQDKDGNDALARYLGMLSPGAIESPGYWEGASNPATHQLIGSTRIKAAGKSPEIDAASKELMNVYGDAMGLVLKQDGVGYHRPYYNPKVSQANGIEYKFDKPLTSDHIVNMGKALDKHVPGSALIPVGDRTMRVLNFNDTKDHRGFHKNVDSVLQSGILPDGHTAEKRLFASDGDLRGNDWEKNPNGEDYRQRLSASSRPDVLGYISNFLAPRVQAFDKSFAEKYGLKRNEALENTLNNLHEEPQNTGPVTPPEEHFKQGGDVDPAFTHADQAASLNYLQDPNLTMPANLLDQEEGGDTYAQGGDVKPNLLSIIAETDTKPVRRETQPSRYAQGGTVNEHVDKAMQLVRGYRDGGDPTMPWWMGHFKPLVKPMVTAIAGPRATGEALVIDMSPRATTAPPASEAKESPVSSNALNREEDPYGIGSPNYNAAMNREEAPPPKAQLQAQFSNPPLPPRRPDNLGDDNKPGFFNRLFSGGDYQSNNALVAPKGSTSPSDINWGNQDSSADFFRASNALQKMDPNYVANNADDTYKSGGAVDHNAAVDRALGLIRNYIMHGHMHEK